MFISWRTALAICSVSIVLFASTFLEAREKANISFSTRSGYSGTVTLDLPRRIFSGDEVSLSARVSVSNTADFPPPSALAGRLEAGFEELAPVGRVTVNLDSGENIKLAWKLRTGSSTVYPATLWLWLRNDSSEELLIAREFELVSRDYLGMDIRSIRITASLTALVSLLMAGFILWRSR